MLHVFPTFIQYNPDNIVIFDNYNLIIMLKKTSFPLFMILSFGIFFLTQSCQKNNETNISGYNDTESHNMGQNCMNCHNPDGKGQGSFVAAGTVYDSLFTTRRKNGTVKLYTGLKATGTLRATIEVDGNGNFYTTEDIDFSGGIYPTITGSEGDIHYMTSSIQMGQCNSCHGVTTNKIWVR
jgi:hypothetical protein